MAGSIVRAAETTNTRQMVTSDHSASVTSDQVSGAPGPGTLSLHTQEQYFNLKVVKIVTCPYKTVMYKNVNRVCCLNYIV